MITREEALRATEALYQRLSNRRPDVNALDGYYRGDQKLRFATDAWTEEHAKRYQGFSDNWCGVVANSPSERLRVEGFRLGDSFGRSMSDAERQLWQDWQVNELDMQSSQGFLESIVARRSYVTVWGDENDEPTASWEHPSQVIVDYDPENPRRRRYALKSWTADGMEYATLYTPDELWKWERESGSGQNMDPTQTGSGLFVVRNGATGSGVWQQRNVPGEEWPLSNPLGEVNIVEFANRPQLGNSPISEIEGTRSMQDAINLLWSYLFLSADHASFPARVVMGQEPPKLPILDSNGQKIGEKTVDLKALQQGRMLWLTGQSTKIDSWQAASLEVFTKVVEVAVTHIAAQTRTPQHYLVGKMANLSADALKAAETGLVKKVEEQQLFYGPSVREVFRLFALVRGDQGLARSIRTDGNVVWRDAESRSEAQLADALLKLKQIGFPFQYLAERYGLSPTEVARVLDMRQAEPDALALSSLAEQYRQPTTTPPQLDQQGAPTAPPAQ